MNERPKAWIKRQYDDVVDAVSEVVHKFLVAIDAESIRTFQTMYYSLIPLAGIYLFFFAQTVPSTIEGVMGTTTYDMWLWMNILCPPFALMGRWISKRAANKDVDQPNSSYGAAWMQMTGDMGTWLAICIYILCVFDTSWWGQGLYAVFFVGMGVPGGFMFTLRSVRRLIQIKQRERIKKAGL